jgi:hypothetical protein
MTPDIDRLIVLCEKAVTAKVVELQPAGRMLRYEVDADFANFLRTATPQTILALCAENKRLTEEVERLRGEGELCVLAKDLAAEASVMETLSKSANYSGDERKTYAWCARELRMMANQTQLRTGAHSTSAAAEGAVTDAMVEAACVAFEKHPTTLASDYETPAMRAALEAALAAAPGGERK